MQPQNHNIAAKESNLIEDDGISEGNFLLNFFFEMTEPRNIHIKHGAAPHRIGPSVSLEGLSPASSQVSCSEDLNSELAEIRSVSGLVAQMFQ
jgi:hypothetical protein